MTSITQPKLEITGLKKHFGTAKVLDGVDLSLARGKSLAVLGRSGTGKSVLFKCIVGILTPDSGRVVLDGVELGQANRKQRKELLSKVAVVFQGSALFDSLPVWRNVMFARLMNGQAVKRDYLMTMAESYLTQVGMTANDLAKSTAELSGGMQKRVAIARALAQEPELIFFDEPTTGLDPITAGTIDDLIAQVRQSSGATTITITHDMSTARIVADQALFLEGGQVQWNGDVSVLADFIAKPTPGAGSDLPPMLQQFLIDRAVTRG